MEEQNKYISVGEMAEYLGRTSQQVYNLLHNGEIAGMEFNRGSMRGWLVVKPSDYDEWSLKRKGA